MADWDRDRDEWYGNQRDRGGWGRDEMERGGDWHRPDRAGSGNRTSYMQLRDRDDTRDDRYAVNWDREPGGWRNLEADRDRYAGPRADGGFGDSGFGMMRDDYETRGRGYGMRRASDDEPFGTGRSGPGMQNFRGRGPKGFQRSDERLRELVSERLADHPAIDASDIEVVVANGEVTLTGTVDDRRTKRLAEDVAESVGGIHDVHNHLKVDRGFFSRMAENARQMMGGGGSGETQ